jgi:hypothetical protein
MQLHYNATTQHDMTRSQQLHLSAEIHSSIGDAARWPSWPLTSGRTSFRDTKSWGKKNLVPSEPQNSWDLWMWITH